MLSIYIDFIYTILQAYYSSPALTLDAALKVTKTGWAMICSDEGRTIMHITIYILIVF